MYDFLDLASNESSTEPEVSAIVGLHRNLLSFDEVKFNEATNLIKEHMAGEWSNRMTFVPFPISGIGELVNPRLFLYKVSYNLTFAKICFSILMNIYNQID